MMDAPFRVVREVRGSHGVYTVGWAIKRTGENTVCWMDDVVYAYRIVELLNEQEADCPTSAPPSTLSAPASG
jgi:hypothetical protein